MSPHARKSLSLFLGLIVACTAFASQGDGQKQADDKKQDEVKKSLVAKKLEAAHKLLDAVAMTDYSMVERHAQSLIQNSKDLVWQKIRSERYEEMGKDYRRDLDSLIKAARAKNNEAMSLAYVKVSLACFNCHSEMRESRIAR